MAKSAVTIYRTKTQKKQIEIASRGIANYHFLLFELKNKLSSQTNVICVTLTLHEGR